ncbi:MAG: hypothetical protein CK424_08490 [Legionella sp.]|nr:MAG: hypothetical protein CK424_08490 [Legionella sp.]
MKKTAFFVLISSTIVCNAHECATHHSDDFLTISIKNNTSFACHLNQTDLKQGKIHALTTIPQQISSGQESRPIVIHEWNTVDLSLTYQCGDNQFITIKSQKNGKMVKAIVTSASNMNANYNTTPAVYNYSAGTTSAGSIYWTLY